MSGSRKGNRLPLTLTDHSDDDKLGSGSHAGKRATNVQVKETQMKSRTKSTAGAPGVAPLLSQPGTVENGPIRRRSALRTLGMAGVAVGAGLGIVSTALAQGQVQAAPGLTAGDV